MNNHTKIALITVGALGLVAGVNGIRKVKYGTKHCFRYIKKNVQPLRKTRPRCEFEQDGSYTLVKDHYDTFKILQLTDLHIGGGFLSQSEDDFAIQTIAELVHKAQPDLVVITGDLVYSRPKVTGSVSNLNSAKIVAKLMEKLNVWYTITFGNHDAEYFTATSRAELKKFFMNQKGCLLTDPNPEVFGESNHIIKVRNEDGTLNNALFMIDSNSYPERLGKGGYDCIHDDQVRWYGKQMEHLAAEENGVNRSLMFMHIPLREYQTAWRHYRELKNDVKYFFGAADEEVSFSKYSTRIFEEILEHKGTKGIFCGHDHLNDFSIEYKGVRLTYGKSIDCILYAKNLSGHRGGTMISLDYDGSFDVRHVSSNDDNEEFV